MANYLVFNHTEFRIPVGGYVVPPNGARQVPKEDADKWAERKGAKSLLGNKQIVLTEPKPETEAPASAPELDEKDQIRAELDAAGVSYDGRWGIEKLRSLLPDPTSTEEE